MGLTRDRRAVVLGGSRGIGAAVVKRLRDEGAEVSFTFFGSPERAEAVAGETGARAIKADSTDRVAVREALASVGPIDILVVSAGISVTGTPEEIDPDEVDRQFAINVAAPFHAVAIASGSMRDGGRIVLIGSTLGARVGYPGLAAYSASKAALVGMARGFSRDFGGRGITVNVVEPGATDTDMNPADGPLKDLMHEPMSIKRHIQPAEVAGLVAFLAGPDAAMITGAAYLIDGGTAT